MADLHSLIDSSEQLTAFLKDLEARKAPIQPPLQSPKLLIELGYSQLYEVDGAIVFQSGLTINADGSPRAYHPDGKSGLDFLANAGRPGNWFGIATDNGRPRGTPLIQAKDDPSPGFYISTTSLVVPGFPDTSQRRYVNSEEVPFFVLPAHLGMGVALGDLGLSYNIATGDNEFFILADTGPRGQIGEGSIKLAQGLKVNTSPKHGGVGGGILSVIFPGSGDEYQEKSVWYPVAGKLFAAWGGLERIRTVLGEGMI